MRLTSQATSVRPLVLRVVQEAGLSAMAMSLTVDVQA